MARLARGPHLARFAGDRDNPPKPLPRPHPVGRPGHRGSPGRCARTCATLSKHADSRGDLTRVGARGNRLRMVDVPDRTLAELLQGRLRPEGWQWIEKTSGDLTAGRIDLAPVFPAVSRHTGRGGLDHPGARVTTATGEVIELAAWRIDDAARVYLMLVDARRLPGGALPRAQSLYLQGDARERTGVLRALSLLPGASDDAAALPAVVDAMRVNQGEIFEAAICDNPYASHHLSQHDWRKAVLKAVFGGYALSRIADLPRRLDAELARSLVAFASEREAASRVVPADLWPVAATFPPPGLAAKLIGYLEHPNVDQRRAAAQALVRLAGDDPRLRPFLVDRASRETVEPVLAILRRVLAD